MGIIDNRKLMLEQIKRLKGQLNESVNEANNRLNNKVKKMLNNYLGKYDNTAESQHALMLILKRALVESNFHSQAKQLDKFFPNASKSKYVGTSMESVIEDNGVDIAKWAKWDGHDIIDAVANYAGGELGSKLQSLKTESVNEALDGSDIKKLSLGDGEFVQASRSLKPLTYKGTTLETKRYVVTNGFYHYGDDEMNATILVDKSGANIVAWSRGMGDANFLKKVHKKLFKTESVNEATSTIQKGNIVNYKKGWYTVSTIYRDGTANLKGVFNKHLYHKRVPMTDMVEDGEGFWNWYQNSDAYRQS